MKLSIIAAMDRNRVIGRDNRLPWRLPADLARFKKLTMGHYLLMGRKTYESLGRSLPGRTIVVITRQANYSPAGALVAQTIDQAIALAKSDEVFVAGGEQIYRQTLHRADRMYLTLIEQEFPGDAFFPEFDPSAWRLLAEEHHPSDEANPYPFRFVDYERARQDTKAEDTRAQNT